MGEAVLRLSGVTFSYVQHPVLEGIDLEVAAGEFLGLIGPNGSENRPSSGWPWAGYPRIPEAFICSVSRWKSFEGGTGSGMCPRGQQFQPGISGDGV